jgi:hypothetical protein
MRLKEFIKNNYVFNFIFNSVYYIMDNFVLTENEEGKIMAGGYIINDKLIVPSMTGGNRNDEEENDYIEMKYAVPAGLYYIEVPDKESSIEILYKNNNVLSDDIYDNLYNNAIFVKTTEIIKDENKNKNTNKNTNTNVKNTNVKNKNTKKKNKSASKNNKKSRKQK